ncbi:MAG: hypothetical protein ACOYJD_05225 [Christensenellales bacterium]|jgi:hypothetical protein
MDKHYKNNMDERVSHGVYNGFGIESGSHVEADAAFAYALARLTRGNAALKEEFTEWFFSGNWILERRDNSEGV